MNPREGLPKLRAPWVAKRQGDAVVTQMHYAKRGIITEEMYYVAARENMDPEFVRSEVGHRRKSVMKMTVACFGGVEECHKGHRCMSIAAVCTHACMQTRR